MSDKKHKGVACVRPETVTPRSEADPRPPTTSEDSLEQCISDLENEVEYWNREYKNEQERADEVEKRVEELQERNVELKDHTRDQAKGHRQDLLCWTIEKQRLVKEIESRTNRSFIFEGLLREVELHFAHGSLDDGMELWSRISDELGEPKQEGTPSKRKVLASVGTPRRMGRVEKDSVELGNDQDTCPTGVPISIANSVNTAWESAVREALEDNDIKMCHDEDGWFWVKEKESRPVEQVAKAYTIHVGGPELCARLKLAFEDGAAWAARNVEQQVSTGEEKTQQAPAGGVSAHVTKRNEGQRSDLARPGEESRAVEQPNKRWRKEVEQFKTPIEKFEYLAGLSDLSWEDCQDAWFMSRQLIPEIAPYIKAQVAIQEQQVGGPDESGTTGLISGDLGAEGERGIPSQAPSVASNSDLNDGRERVEPSETVTTDTSVLRNALALIRVTPAIMVDKFRTGGGVASKLHPSGVIDGWKHQIIADEALAKDAQHDCKEQCRHTDDCNYSRCMPGEEEDG